MTHAHEKQLQILARLHYVAAGLASAIPLVGALYGAWVLAILLGKVPGGTTAAARTCAWVVLGMCVAAQLVGLGAIGLNCACARGLGSYRNHRLCLLASAVNCVFFPFGTLLGTFTLIVLCRPEVRASFKQSGTLGARVCLDPPAGAPSPTALKVGRDG